MEDDSLNGVMPLERALDIAESLGKDVVEISGNQEISVVRIVEFSKFKYEQKKKKQQMKSTQTVVKMKEIRFGPNTDQHDFDFKLKHATKFLEEGNKVRAYVHFRGRAIVYQDRGKKILLEFAQALQELGKVEMLPKLEGKRMYIILAPKKTPKKKPKPQSAEQKKDNKPAASEEEE
jgi:translation initiation factor IF-3